MFKIGDKVKLVTNRYGDHENNPVWNGEFGKIEGTIYTIDNTLSLPICVKWIVLNTKELYEDKDLELIEEEEINTTLSDMILYIWSNKCKGD